MDFSLIRPLPARRSLATVFSRTQETSIAFLVDIASFSNIILERLYNVFNMLCERIFP